MNYGKQARQPTLQIRKKGVRANTREHTIFFGMGGEPFEIRKIRRLCSEFHFNVQLVIQ